MFILLTRIHEGYMFYKNKLKIFLRVVAHKANNKKLIKK